jgi:hypothetical protein
MSDYLTTSELKTWLSISGSGDDTLLGLMCDSAEAIVKQKIGVNVVAASATRYYHAVNDVRSNGADLMVDYHAALTSVTNGDGTAVSTLNIDRLPMNGTYKNRLHLKASSGLTWTYSTDPVGAIAVVATWGLVAAAANVPADIEQVTKEIAAWLYRNRDSSMASEILAVARGGTILAPGKMPPALASMLNRLGSVIR